MSQLDTSSGEEETVYPICTLFTTKSSSFTTATSPGIQIPQACLKYVSPSRACTSFSWKVPGSFMLMLLLQLDSRVLAVRLDSWWLRLLNQRLNFKMKHLWRRHWDVVLRDLTQHRIPWRSNTFSQQCNVST